MTDKNLTKLGAGWIIEEAGKYRYNRPDGSFLRVIRFPKEWVVCNFGVDGSGTQPTRTGDENVFDYHQSYGQTRLDSYRDYVAR